MSSARLLRSVFIGLVVSLVMPGSGHAQQPTAQITVTVSAAEAKQMRDDAKSLEARGDPFLASLSAHVVSLIRAIAAPQLQRHLFTIGPQTEVERSIFDVREYLARSSAPEGPIHVAVRLNWSDNDPRVFAFTEPGFLSMIAALAKGPMVQVPALQRYQVLFVGRMLLDLNEQAGGVIPQDIVLEALANGFSDRRAGRRLAAVTIFMADHGGVYDAVPARRLAEFQKLFGEAGFFIADPETQPHIVQIRWGTHVVATRSDHLIWSCLRLFSGDNSGDWVEHAEASQRSNLGREMLDYLEAQAQLRLIDELAARLPSSPAPSGRVELGNVPANGLEVGLLKNAPGVVRGDAKDGRVSLGVKDTRAADFGKWLEERKRGVSAIVTRQ